MSIMTRLDLWWLRGTLQPAYFCFLALNIEIVFNPLLVANFHATFCYTERLLIENF
jgi:hypothetical protein